MVSYQGFEDILLLDEIMERYDSDFAKVLPEFSELRCDDAHAICDLAMYNYVEVCIIHYITRIFIRMTRIDLAKRSHFSDEGFNQKKIFLTSEIRG